jgi:hypothetical protein
MLTACGHLAAAQAAQSGWQTTSFPQHWTFGEESRDPV